MRNHRHAILTNSGDPYESVGAPDEIIKATCTHRRALLAMEHRRPLISRIIYACTQTRTNTKTHRLQKKFTQAVAWMKTCFSFKTYFSSRISIWSMEALKIKYY